MNRPPSGKKVSGDSDYFSGLKVGNLSSEGLG
jgi:hypothetical protein